MASCYPDRVTVEVKPVVDEAALVALQDRVTAAVAAAVRRGNEEAVVNVSIVCPYCPQRFEFTQDSCFGFVTGADHGCMTVTIAGDRGAVDRHMREHHRDVS